MLCERCDNSEATFHLTEISNNVQSELHLCLSCAKKMKLEAQRGDCSVSLKSMFTFFHDDTAYEEATGICMECGLTGIEIGCDGKPGCPDCYKYFKSILSLKSYSENTKYSGKIPFNYIEVMDTPATVTGSNNAKPVKIELAELEEKLGSAVMEEHYEEAAKLRDIIKEVRSIE